MTSGSLAYSYHLPHLGYPHELAQSQETEPFWQQLDQVQEFSLPPHVYPTFGYTHYNYVYDPFGMHDFVPVFIGSNTANGKVITGETSNRRGRHQNHGLLKRFGRVSLFVGDEHGETHVGDPRVQDLIRFSKIIGAKFADKKEAKPEDQGEESDDEKLGFTVEVTPFNGTSRKVKLINSREKIWSTPPAWALAEVLSWMNDVRGIDRNSPLPQFCVEDIESYGLHDLVAVYAATIVLDLRPRAVLNTLRGCIIKDLAYRPATGEDFQYLHEHLPVGDIVLKKMIETFLMHGERNHYKQRNYKGEVTKVREYVNCCGHEEFRRLVIGTMDARNEERMERLKEGKDKGVVAGKGKGGRAQTVKGAGQTQVASGSSMPQAPTAKGEARQQTPPAPVHGDTAAGEETAVAGLTSPKDSAVESPPKVVATV